MKINEYPIESLTFQDADYYDVDFWNGVTFETRKILGSVIKVGIRHGIFSPTVAGVVPASTGGTVKFLRADGTWVAPNPVLITETSNSTAVASTNTTTWLTHLNVTPIAGEYLATIGLEASNSGANQTVHIGIGKNGVLEANTERRNGIPFANAFISTEVSKRMTLNGTDVVNLLVRMSGGTTTSNAKSIHLTKIG